MKTNRRFSNEVNAGSMADIAFLLLIFFLVTTTILNETGIAVKLPPWEETIILMPVSERNVLSVLVNKDNQLLVEKKQLKLENLKAETKNFLLNPTNSPDLAASPTKAVVSLINDRGTSYETYLQVYNELQAAYREIWEDQAQQQFQKSYDDLSKSQQAEIRKQIPLVISEAEPTDLAGI